MNDTCLSKKIFNYMVALLVDPQSGWVTGQNILVNGGFAA